MKRIILHWTAGGPIPTAYEKSRYHFLVDSIGKVHAGEYTPEAHLDCADNLYAAHTGGGNTGSIGVSMCAMADFKDKNNKGRYPITKEQFEATMKLCAELADNYNIEITPESIMTHYEFGQKHPSTTSYGKIDIVFLPPFPWVAKDDIGGFIRSKIKWYLNNLKKEQ